MRKFLITGMAVAMLAVPSAAMADAPNGDPLVTKGNAKVHTNAVANGSARITQNGQWVGGTVESWNDHTDAPNGQDYFWIDQTDAPGSRGDYVQSLLGHTKHAE